jgi:hypothetical protein
MLTVPAKTKGQGVGSRIIRSAEERQGAVGISADAGKRQGETMSHRISTETVKSRLNQQSPTIEGIGEVLDSLQTVETMENTNSETVCANPLCSARFSEGGMPQSPKRFCSDTCGQKASLLRRVAMLLESFSPEQAYEILMRARNGHGR